MTALVNGRIEYLVHLAAKAVDRVRDKAAGLVDSRKWRNCGLIELLHLLDNLVDLAQRTTDVVLDRAEDRFEDIEDAGVCAHG